MEKILFILAFLVVAIANNLKPLLNWWASNPLMWTDSVGYLPILLIITSLVLSPHILKRLKQ